MSVLGMPVEFMAIKKIFAWDAESEIKREIKEAEVLDKLSRHPDSDRLVNELYLALNILPPLQAEIIRDFLLGLSEKQSYQKQDISQSTYRRARDRAYQRLAAVLVIDPPDEEEAGSEDPGDEEISQGDAVAAGLEYLKALMPNLRVESQQGRGDITTATALLARSYQVAGLEGIDQLKRLAKKKFSSRELKNPMAAWVAAVKKEFP